MKVTRYLPVSHFRAVRVLQTAWRVTRMNKRALQEKAGCSPLISGVIPLLFLCVVVLVVVSCTEEVRTGRKEVRLFAAIVYFVARIIQRAMRRNVAMKARSRLRLAELTRLRQEMARLLEEERAEEALSRCKSLQSRDTPQQENKAIIQSSESVSFTPHGRGVSALEDHPRQRSPLCSSSQSQARHLVESRLTNSSTQPRTVHSSPFYVSLSVIDKVRSHQR